MPTWTVNDGNASCFTSVFGNPVRDNSARFTFDHDGSEQDETSVATTDTLTVTTGQRIALYCKSTDNPDADNKALVTRANVMAIPAARIIETNAH